MKSKLKETDLAKKIVDWLIDDGWEVFQEVPSGYGGATPDIVARRGKYIWVIETKTSFTLDVIQQAHNWIGRAHFVSVAIPAGVTSHRDQFQFRKLICETFGIGVIVYDSRNEYDVNLDSERFAHLDPVKSNLQPKFNRSCFDYWEKTLKPEMKTFCAAGSTTSHRRYTPFTATVLTLVDYVKRHPGTTLKEALSEIKHHYRTSSTAFVCLTDYIHKGVIKELKFVKDGKKLTLYLADLTP